MKDLKRRLFSPTGSEAIEREGEEELQFHLDLLTQQNLQQADSFEEARACALRRFGNVEQVKDECVEISKRNRAVMRVLKSFFVLVFLLGILVRIFSDELHVDRVGQMLIAIGFMGRLFLYVRGLKPAVFRQKSDTSSPLMLNNTYKAPTSLFDADNL
jgi:hypothetical protein